MKLHGIFALLTVIAAPLSAMAECTSKSGDIEGEVWSQAGSPYCIEGDIRILDLVITPGVQIEFAGAYVFQIDPFATRFEAQGTDAQPIIFTSQSLDNDWDGIWFNGVGPSASLLMDQCRVEYADNSGITITDCYPTIRNCDITKNHNSSGAGGGMRITLDGPIGDLVLSDCRINNNAATGNGGGIWMNVSSGSLTLQRCEINTNDANRDDATGHRHGGGVFISDAAGELAFEDCDISSNRTDSFHYDNVSSTSYGGGLYLGQGTLRMRRCSIGDNTTYAYSYDPSYGSNRNSYPYGGGLYLNEGTAVLSNCTVSSNAVTGGADGTVYPRGAGLFNKAATLSLENCTIAYNNDAEGVYEQGGAVYVLNSIVYFNTGDQLSAGVAGRYSCIQGGWSDPDSTNIDADPEFYGVDDLRIRCSASPCVDAGDPVPYYDDACQACGTSRNDMGAGGGPNNCEPSGCDLLIEITDYPAIVNAGEVFAYTVCVSNPCESVLSFDEVVLDVAGPGVSIALPLMDGITVPVSSGSTLCAEQRQFVPIGVAPGLYTGTTKLYRVGELLHSYAASVTVQ